MHKIEAGVCLYESGKCSFEATEKAYLHLLIGHGYDILLRELMNHPERLTPRHDGRLVNRVRTGCEESHDGMPPFVVCGQLFHLWGNYLVFTAKPLSESLFGRKTNESTQDQVEASPPRVVQRPS